MLCSGALCQAAMIATELCRGKKWSRQHEARYLCSMRQGIAKNTTVLHRGAPLPSLAAWSETGSFVKVLREVGFSG